ncbi:CAMK family protein kinase [Trichomonas vaginalis G3]|uniref:CAMK family protein kinase n=1 Tax=Trichomonas vaginalis (strain ATCC PRA-98 / G3) TaxID=412133 RepID=A2FV14_TRIV3|nr:protein serine/threonine kinase protein [Trichomonas vaginalis G3]EAX91244.1 CAMK family protein kinase [Trichomonas vaginalis G3]KAI5509093.1 protein serine/threonine kinase protein [Trichomonas vaginalis G3]|eukprot:XP_001304174.1 CAMK family protein kinase [Trichomonas vaginalis G3]
MENTVFQSSSKITIPNYIGHYKVIKTIGKGGFAVVVLAIDTRNQQKVAIKIIDRKEVEKQELLTYLENELRLSARFDHPNIVKVYDILYDPERIMIIMEYVPNGDLQTLIFRGISFTLEEQLNICYEILQALQYLHHRGISHRDLKPENILFDLKFHPKIIDFGLSKEKCEKLHTYCGTTLYMAPEVILCDTYDGSKADVWAFGVTAHILAAQAFPWGLKSEAQYLKCIQMQDISIDVIPKGIIGLIISKSLIFDPAQRANVDV